MHAFVVVGGGIPASILGGYVSDKMEEKYPSIKGLIAGVGALVAVPFILVAYGFQPGFYYSISFYFVGYFTAEMWYGPSHAQINNMFPSEYQGLAIAIFNLAGSITGTIATLLLGLLKTKFNTDCSDECTDLQEEENAKMDGYILCAAVLVSYLTCGPLFIISGNKYGEQLEKNKATIKKNALSK